MHVDVGIDAAGGEGDDARAGERLGDQGRDVRVHRPGEFLAAARAELAPGHEHDIGQLGQGLDLLAVEEIGGDAFDAMALQAVAQTLLAETGHADHPLGWSGALGQPR